MDIAREISWAEREEATSLADFVFSTAPMDDEATSLAIAYGDGFANQNP